MIEISLEKLDAELATELMPLLEQHYDEIAKHKEIKLSPDWYNYFLLEEMGKFKIFVAREEGKLVGYVAYMVHAHIHYSENIFAVQDVFFVSKDRRGMMTGIKLLKHSEEKLKEMGVDIIIQHVKYEHDFSSMLKKIGYNDFEKLLSKRI